MGRRNNAEFHHFHGRPEASHAGKRSAASAVAGACYEFCTLQGKQGLGRSEPIGWMADYAERDESIRRNYRRAIASAALRCRPRVCRVLPKSEWGQKRIMKMLV